MSHRKRETEDSKKTKRHWVREDRKPEERDEEERERDREKREREKERKKER